MHLYRAQKLQVVDEIKRVGHSAFDIYCAAHIFCRFVENIQRVESTPCLAQNIAVEIALPDGIADALQRFSEVYQGSVEITSVGVATAEIVISLRLAVRAAKV